MANKTKVKDYATNNDVSPPTPTTGTTTPGGGIGPMNDLLGGRRIDWAVSSLNYSYKSYDNKMLQIKNIKNIDIILVRNII